MVRSDEVIRMGNNLLSWFPYKKEKFGNRERETQGQYHVKIGAVLS